MPMLQTISVLAVTFFTLPESGPVLPHSEAPKPPAQYAQVWGAQCQTPFGICLMVDQFGNPVQAPVGSPCFCGPDAGTVIP